jgi:YD repeat-containing protein
MGESAAYDYRTGTLTSITDPNGSVISAEYDVFGRIVKLIQPGDTSALPTVQATYADTELPFRYTIAKRIDSNTAAVQTISQFYDGLGRKIQTKTETDNNATSTVVDTQYNGMGQPVREYRARLQNDTAATIIQYTPTPSTGVYSTTTTYDALGRVLTTIEPNGAKSLHTYGIINSLTYHDVVDPNRHRTQQRSDVFGRLVQVDEIKGNCGAYLGYPCGTGDVAWAVDAVHSTPTARWTC